MRRRIWKWIKRLVLFGLASVLLAVAAFAVLWLYYDRGLPSVEELRNYRPPQVTKVYCADGADACYPWPRYSLSPTCSPHSASPSLIDRWS